MGKRAGAKNAPPHFVAAKKGDLHVLVDCLKADPTLRDSVNGDGWTLLHQAAYSGQEAVLKGLIKAGANPRARDYDGCTPLHYASAQGHIAAIRVLAEAGADLDAMDNDGEMPLDVADGPRTRTAIRRLIEVIAARSAGGGGAEGPAGDGGGGNGDGDGDDDGDSGGWEEAGEAEAEEAIKDLQASGGMVKPVRLGLKGSFTAAMHGRWRRAENLPPPQRRAYVPDEVPTRAVKKL